METKQLGLAGVASAFPPNIVDNDYFGEGLKGTKNKMFMGTSYRRHIGKGQKAGDLIIEAGKKLVSDLRLDPKRDIDMILTNVSIPDECFTGCGAVVVNGLGADVKWVYDLHNTGCVAFMYLLDLAQSVITANNAKSALICCVQSAAGRIFAQPEIRKLPQAAIPGDGCGVAYVTTESPSPFLNTIHHCYGEFAEDMYGYCDDGRKYWEPGMSAGHINFTEEKMSKITIRGNRLVPKIIKEACELNGRKTNDIDILVTNQPNSFFLRNWREAIQIPPERHLDTFSKYANLFGAGIPVTLEEGISDGRIKAGDLVCLAGFSHAGDYAAATLLEWNGGLKPLDEKGV